MAEYRLATQSLVDLAQRDLTSFWRSLNVQGDPTRVRDAVLEFFPELVALYGEPAAVLGADWYDMLRDVPPSSASFRAAAAVDAVQADQSVSSARWGLGPLFAGEPDGSLALLTGVTQRLVMQPYRTTVERAAAKDPVRSGVARIPSGPTTCKWCVMIASRGAVYTKETASGAWHDHCDCMPTVIRSPGDYPDDYDLSAMERLYAEQSGIGRDVPADS